MFEPRGLVVLPLIISASVAPPASLTFSSRPPREKIGAFFSRVLQLSGDLHKVKAFCSFSVTVRKASPCNHQELEWDAIISSFSSSIRPPLHSSQSSIIRFDLLSCQNSGFAKYKFLLFSLLAHFLIIPKVYLQLEVLCLSEVGKKTLHQSLKKSSDLCLTPSSYRFSYIQVVE